MVLAVVALVIPAVYAQVTQHKNPGHIESISLDISYVLILTYAASLVFSLKTHQRLFAPKDDEDAAESIEGKPWSVSRGLGVLLGAGGFARNEAMRKGILQTASQNGEKKIADFIHTLGAQKVRFSNSPFVKPTE